MPFQSFWKILGPHIAPRRKRSWNEISIYASLLKVILSIIENYARLRVFIQKRYTFAPLVNFVSTRVLETRIWTNESTRVHTHTHTGARTRPTASRLFVFTSTSPGVTDPEDTICCSRDGPGFHITQFSDPGTNLLRPILSEKKTFF